MVDFDDLSVQEKIRLSLPKAFTEGMDLNRFAELWKKDDTAWSQYPPLTFDDVRWVLSHFARDNKYESARSAGISHADIVVATNSGLSVDALKNLKAYSSKGIGPDELLAFARQYPHDKQLYDLYIELRHVGVAHNALMQSGDDSHVHQGTAHIKRIFSEFSRAYELLARNSCLCFENYYWSTDSLFQAIRKRSKEEAALFLKDLGEIAAMMKTQPHPVVGKKLTELFD